MFTKNNGLKSAARKYWQSLYEANNPAIMHLINNKFAYGENQDFVTASVAYLSPKYGYIRSETLSVYFREWKRTKVGQVSNAQ